MKKVVIEKNFNLENDFKELVGEITNDVADETILEMKKAIEESPASGRTYGTHIASSPGNAPRSETETLINSFEPQVISFNQINIWMQDYGAWLDKGDTPNVAARPFIEKSIDTALENVVNM